MEQRLRRRVCAAHGVHNILAAPIPMTMTLSQMSHKPLNDAALAELRPIYAAPVLEADSRRRLARNPELALIAQDKQAILARHQNDYKMFSLTGLSNQELRAILASLPEYRRDQRVQLEFRDRLEELIETTARRQSEAAADANPRPAQPPPKRPTPAAATPPHPPPPPSGMYLRMSPRLASEPRCHGTCTLAGLPRGQGGSSLFMEGVDVVVADEGSTNALMRELLARRRKIE